MLNVQQRQAVRGPTRQLLQRPVHTRLVRAPLPRRPHKQRTGCFAEPSAGEAPVTVAAAASPELDAFSSSSSYCLSYEDDSNSQLAFAAEVELPLEQEAERLAALLQRLRACSSLADKVALLDTHAALVKLRQSTRFSPMWGALDSLELKAQYVIKCLPAIGQSHVLALQPKGGDWHKALQHLAASLLRVESFYDSMGGVIGYQLKSLELITGKQTNLDTGSAASAHGSDSATGSSSFTVDGMAQQQQQQQQQQQGEEEVTYHVPPGLDLAGEAGRQLGVRAAAQGLMSLPYMAEIYPVGGAGDRLGLQCDVTGQSLPAAMLPYCGRSMIEGLMRDLQAREYLYWHLTGKQVTTPAAIMTSDAKGNHARITALMEHLDWFGRGKEAFRLFRQPLVPVINSETGRWLLSDALTPMMKPGGHGAIWKLMHDEGVFTWLESQRRASAIVRQISNPMAAVDTTLLALAGTGFAQRRSFGFMSCERVVGAAEGMNVLQERKHWVPDASHPDGGSWEYQYAITNVEYTEFERLGISDMAQEGSNHSVFPANTNILYVGLQAAKGAVQRAIASGGADVLPGLIFNRKKRVAYKDPATGVEAEVKAGRMECTMQNLADALGSKSPFSMMKPAGRGSSSSSSGSSSVKEAGAAPGLAVVDKQLAQQLSTFMVYNLRRKVTSSAKKRRAPGSEHIHQTPDGSFYDLMRNGWQVLQRCGMRYVPEVGDVQNYLEQGPGFIFLFHPALGPLWDVIAQKVRGGALLDGSELVLEVAEARLLDVTIDGSLLVAADAVMGKLEEAGGGSSGRRLRYSQRCGRVHMMNVTVQNVGVDWHHPGNLYWRHQLQRHEACRVILHGTAEFEAYDCKITGDQVFEVPDGYRMVVTASPRGVGLQTQLLPLQGDVPTWEWRYSMDAGGAIGLEFQRNSAVVPWHGGAAAAVVEDQVLDFVI